MRSSAAAAGGAALLGSGLGSLSAAAARQDFSGKLTVWGVVSFTEAGDDLLGQQMRDWGDANGVEVEYVALPGSDYATKIATAVESGAIPDVVMMIYDLTIIYANQNRLVDLSDVFDELNQLAGGIWPSLLPHVQADGKTYSIPMEADVSVMYSRLDLIEEATGERVLLVEHLSHRASHSLPVHCPHLFRMFAAVASRYRVISGHQLSIRLQAIECDALTTTPATG